MDQGARRCEAPGNSEGYCYHHVQAIIVAIDQYAEAALGNSEFFLNRPRTEVAEESGDHSPNAEEHRLEAA